MQRPGALPGPQLLQVEPRDFLRRDAEAPAEQMGKSRRADHAAEEGAHVSQPVFARYLNTSESTVEKWETGAKRPSGMALKLLSLVQKHGLEVLA